MSYFTDQLERERAALAAAGHTGALHHRSLHESRIPAIRMYPVAPAQGTLTAAVAAVGQAVMPRRCPIPVPFYSSRKATTAPPTQPPGDTSATAAIARLVSLPPGAHGAACSSPDDMLIASSTAVMLETFLVHAGVCKNAIALVPGLLCSPFENLLNVLRRFSLTVVGFDVNVDTMEADVGDMRAALSGNRARVEQGDASRPVLLLVGVKGRFFRNTPDIYALAKEVGCAVVTVHAPGVVAADPQAAHEAKEGKRTPDRAAGTGVPLSLCITAFDGPGSLGGAVAFSPQKETTAAMRAALEQLPSAGPLGTWKRLARHLCHVLLSHKLDYGSTVWLLALISRAGHGAAGLFLGSQRKASGPEEAGAPTPMEAARQEAMDWVYDLLASHEAHDWVGRPSSTAAESAAAAARGLLSAVPSLLGQAVSATVSAASTMRDAGKAETEEKTRRPRGPISLLGPSSGLFKAPSTAPVSRGSTRVSDSTLEWLRRLLLDHQKQKDAEFVCLWSFLHRLPSYVNIVSAGEAHTPLACVEAGFTSVVLRAECPALVARRLQQEGFAALPARPVAFNGAANDDGAAVQVSTVNGVLFCSTCKKSAAAAKQLCFIPLSPAMTPRDHQLLVDLLSEMPRQWMTASAQPISSVTTGEYRRADGKNFSNADRPYSTPEVRAALMTVSRRYSQRRANSGEDEDSFEQTVEEAMKRLFKGRHPALTYLLYGTQAARLLAAKL